MATEVAKEFPEGSATELRASRDLPAESSRVEKMLGHKEVVESPRTGQGVEALGDSASAAAGDCAAVLQSLGPGHEEESSSPE